MLQRCYNPKHVGFQNYGARGVFVHAEWRSSFAAFVRDVGIKPSWKHTLDRRDASKHYTPDNVRWATAKEQGNNKRGTHFVLHPHTGLRVAAGLLATELQVSYQSLRQRMVKDGTWYALRFEGIPTTEVEPFSDNQEQDDGTQDDD